MKPLSFSERKGAESPPNAPIVALERWENRSSMPPSANFSVDRMQESSPYPHCRGAFCILGRSRGKSSPRILPALPIPYLENKGVLVSFRIPALRFLPNLSLERMLESSLPSLCRKEVQENLLKEWLIHE